MLEQTFNYVGGVIGGGGANAGDTTMDGDQASYSCKIQPYSGWTFWVLDPQQIQAACADAKGRN